MHLVFSVPQFFLSDLVLCAYYITKQTRIYTQVFEISLLAKS